jgi:hypothetical protein
VATLATRLVARRRTVLLQAAMSGTPSSSPATIPAMSPMDLSIPIPTAWTMKGGDPKAIEELPVPGNN